MENQNFKGKKLVFRIRKTGKNVTKKRTFAKINCYYWYGWLVNYIQHPIKTKGGSKDKNEYL